VKYANANRIMVQVIRHKKSIVLMVEDDGTGFDPQEVSREGAGIGLTNVETRVRSLNGNFIVESEKGRGTLMSIEIPC
jgi:signal transduction histidine kinase